MNNVDKALVKKKEFILGSKEIDIISNSGIYDTHKEFYLSKKERNENLIQGVQSANDLKTQMGVKKADGTALTVTIQENAIKKTFDK